MKYYDKQNNRLVCAEKTSSPAFWDHQWNVKNFKKAIENGTKNRLVTKNTTKYVPCNKLTKILEAGCGNGQFVYAFDKLGYDSYGIDYAAKTVSRTKSIFPQLNIRVGDVRKSDFPDNYFDACWSVGVIEHFFEGYDSIIKETDRILKQGGFLFISFPHLSILRKIKIKFNLYPDFNKKSLKNEEFYQFVLDSKRVIKDIEQRGFKLIKKKRFSGLKGLKDEINFSRPILQKLYDSKNKAALMLNYGLSYALSRFSGHAILLIFKKINNF